MNRALWIALGVTFVVIVAHVALFVVFLRDPKPRKTDDEADE